MSEVSLPVWIPLYPSSHQKSLPLPVCKSLSSPVPSEILTQKFTFNSEWFPCWGCSNISILAVLLYTIYIAYFWCFWLELPNDFLQEPPDNINVISIWMDHKTNPGNNAISPTLFCCFDKTYFFNITFSLWVKENTITLTVILAYYGVLQLVGTTIYWHKQVFYIEHIIIIGSGSDKL